jgi:hypothetical protein
MSPRVIAGRRQVRGQIRHLPRPLPLARMQAERSFELEGEHKQLAKGQDTAILHAGTMKTNAAIETRLRVRGRPAYRPGDPGF